MPNPEPPDAESLARSLGAFVEREARRTLSEVQLRPDPQRLADGWERRFITGTERAEELADLYRQLGFEVAMDPIRSEELGDDCGDCRLALLRFRTIYTRRRPEGAG